MRDLNYLALKLLLCYFCLCVDGDKLPTCQETNVSFLNRGDVANIYMGFQEVQNRSISVNYTKCNDFDCTTGETITVNEKEVDVTLSPLATFFGNDTIISITDDGDICGAISYQIPNMQQTG